MRLKEAGLFLLGALIGALLLYYLLWRTDGLAPGHLLARTTADLAGRTEKVPPLPTIPFPTAPAPSPSPEASPAPPEDLSQTPVSLERTAAPTPGLEGLRGAQKPRKMVGRDGDQSLPDLNGEVFGPASRRAAEIRIG